MIKQSDMNDCTNVYTLIANEIIKLRLDSLIENDCYSMLRYYNGLDIYYLDIFPCVVGRSE